MKPQSSLSCSTAALALAGVLCLASFASAAETNLESALARLPKIEYGLDLAEIGAIDTAVAASATNDAQRRDLEKSFLAVLQGDATAAARDYACRQLKIVGSPDAVPALAALLPDPALSGLARYALESIPGPKPDAALRDALGRVDGNLKLGVLSSIAIRRDTAAVKPLAALLKSPDLAVASAAAIALGKIASVEAADALTGFRKQAAPPLRDAVTGAALQAAQRLGKAGRGGKAVGICETILKDSPGGFFHLAAYESLIDALGAKSTPRLLAALAGNDAPQRQLAARLVAELPERPLPAEFLKHLPTLPVTGQVALLGALRLRAEPQSRAAVLALVDSAQPEVRGAAIESLGTLGTAMDAPGLAALASESGTSAEAARKSLVTLRGKDVNAALVATLAQVGAPVRVEILRALGTRSARETAAAVAGELKHTAEPVQKTAANTLAFIGTEADIPALVQALLATKSAGVRDTFANALVSVAGRARDKAVDPLLAGLRGADVPGQCTLLEVLGGVGGAKALDAVRAVVRGPNAEVRAAAGRALAGWPDVAAADDLLDLIRNPENEAARARALAGYIRLARESELAPEARLKMLDRATKLATTADDTRLLLSALGEVQSLDALRLVSLYLGDAVLADEAGAAAVKIIAGLDAKAKDEAAPALQLVRKTAKARPVLDEAEKQMKRLGIPGQ